MSNADTTEPDLTPSTAAKPKSGSPIQQVARLKEYLSTWYPDAALPGEHAADTAIRLLQSQAAVDVSILIAPRCREQYCNKPDGHTDEHGWIG